MSRIDSVELKGHGNAPTPKKLYLTKRKVNEYSNKHFPEQIKDNWVVVNGDGLTAAINKLKVVVNGTEYPTRVIEILAQSANKIHIWFAAYKDIATFDDKIEEVIGVGAITVTIVTETGGTETASGEIASQG